MQLFVLGMHRSGTSAVTRILNMAGAHFGPEGISNGADNGNPKGNWERRDVRAVCDGLLQESEFDWWRLAGFSLDAISDEVRERHLATFRKLLLELDAHRPWVLKEPRLSLLFPLVRPFLEVPVCVHVVREPLEVAESLRLRNGFPTPVGLSLWEVYTTHAFAASHGLPRILVRHDDLLREPVETVSHLLGQLSDLEVQGLRVPSEREITAFLTPDLHRARRSSDGRRSWLSERQAELAAAVEDGRIFDEESPREVSDTAIEILRSFEEGRAREAQLDALEATKTELDRRLAELDGRLAEQGQELADHAARSEQLSARIEDLDQKRSEAERERNEEREHHRESERAAEHRLSKEIRRQEEVERILQNVARDLRAIRSSRTWRLSLKLNSASRRLRPGASRPQKSQLDRALVKVDRARRQVAPSPADDSPPPGPARLVIRSAGTSAAPSGSTGTSRPKVAVVAWDVGHNPLGRAYALAGILGRRFDVEIWGTQFDRYGSGLWEPLHDIDVPVHYFDGTSFPSHLGLMEEAAARIDADAIYVSKPRLPSYGLGVLAKAFRNRPLVLDVDDHELAFFDVDDGLDPRDLAGRRDDPDLALPFGRAWTQICDRLIGAADAVTVSNAALQQRYGGVIVPHARDEHVFDPARYDRDEVRRRLGVSESDRLLLFGGTPRVHKGVVEVLRALEHLGDERYRLALFGTRELQSLRKQIGDLERWVLPLPYQPWAGLAPLVGAADLTCVLQDPTHPVSRYQMPAKVSDALAMGVPCIVSPVEPLRPLIDEGVLHVADGEVPLHERIAQVFDDPADAAQRAAMGRKLFLDSYSYEAVSKAIAPTFETLLADPPPMAPDLAAVVETPRRHFAGATTSAASAATHPARIPGRPRHPITPGAPFDVVVIWKQNDTGIYGRRQDMMVKYLAQSDRVHSIIHFDNPVTVHHLRKTYRSANDKSDQSRLVVRQTLERLAHRRDDGKVIQRTLLHSGTGTRRRGLPPVKEYPSYVASVMKRHGVGTGKRPVVLLAYPTVNLLPEIIDRVDPDLVVADVVDDHRTFTEADPERTARIERNYSEVLARSEVVLANCEPVAEAMTQFAPEVHVVPNGCELIHGDTSGPPPRELAHLDGPVIGYVGNLSQRIDIPLLQSLARARPTWQFVFVGSAHIDRSVLQLEAEPNVHFLGVKPYSQTIRFIQHFDVAIIPHLVNDMTTSMNPLKAFVYCSTGVPVVSTPVANLDALAGLITVAEGTEGFVDAIEEALRIGRRQPDLERLAPQSWEVRVERVLELIDQASSGAHGP